MKKILKKTGLLVCAAALVLSLASCGDSKEVEEEIEDIAADDTDWGESDSDSGGSASSYTGDLANPDVTVAFDDYDGWLEVDKKIGNYEMNGASVCIDGIFEHSGISSYGIGQKKGDEYTGRRLTLTGFDGVELPAVGSRVKLTGIVLYDEETWACTIEVKPENFEVIS